MKYLLLLFCFCARADWKTTQVFYWFNNTQPSVAVTASNIISIDHATGTVGAVQIGDYTGILPGLCTSFISDGVCGGSIQNCQWGHQYNNVTNDIYAFYTCRPVASGISYVYTNVIAGLDITWFSIADSTWYNGTITFDFTPQLVTFTDGSTAVYAPFIFNGHQAVSGDSGSPIFTRTGDFIGCVSSAAGGGQTNGKYLFPSGVHTRPVNPNVPGTAGLSALFNSDPDR